MLPSSALSRSSTRSTSGACRETATNTSLSASWMQARASPATAGIGRARSTPSRSCTPRERCAEHAGVRGAAAARELGQRIEQALQQRAPPRRGCRARSLAGTCSTLRPRMRASSAELVAAGASVPRRAWPTIAWLSPRPARSLIERAPRIRALALAPDQRRAAQVELAASLRAGRSRARAARTADRSPRRSCWVARRGCR